MPVQFSIATASQLSRLARRCTPARYMCTLCAWRLICSTHYCRCTINVVAYPLPLGSQLPPRCCIAQCTRKVLHTASAAGGSALVAAADQVLTGTPALHHAALSPHQYSVGAGPSAGTPAWAWVGIRCSNAWALLWNGHTPTSSPPSCCILQCATRHVSAGVMCSWP